MDKRKALLLGSFALLFAATAIVTAQTSAAPVQPQLVVQLGHSDKVRSAALSPDGRRLVTGSNDHTAILWDADTGQELHTLRGHSNSVTSVAFSPDGHRVLTGSEDHTAKLWDAETGQELRTFEGHSGAVWAVAFSPHGRRVLTGSADKTARLWDTETGQELRTFQGHAGGVTSVVFSPDGGTVLTGSTGDDTARLWDVETGHELRTFPHNFQGVSSLAFSPDGGRVLTGDGYGVAELWDLESGQEPRYLRGYLGFPVSSVGFSPNGQTVLTIGGLATATLWDAETGQVVQSIDPGGNRFLLRPTFSTLLPDGRRALMATADSAEISDTETGRILRRFHGQTMEIDAVAFSPDGHRVLTRASWRAKLWDAETGQQLRTFWDSSGIRDIAFSSDGRRVLTGSLDHNAALWDADTGQKLRTFKGHTDAVVSVAFSPDGQRVLTGSMDKTAKLWDAETGQELRTFMGHSGGIISVAVSRDGRRVLTGSIDKTAKLWDAETGQELRTFKGHTDAIVSVAFSPDGPEVLTGDAKGEVLLWDAETGQELRTFSGHSEWVWSVAFSRDGRRVLTGSGDGTARLWDSATGQELQTFQAHSGVQGVAFSPDGSKVLTGLGAAGTAKLWDAETGRVLCTLVSFNNGTWAVVDPDGRYDASNEGDVAGLHWVIGDIAIDLSQLKNRYYDPGLLAKYLGFNKQPLRQVAKLEAPKLFPEVAVNPPSPGTTKLRIHLSNQGGGIGQVRVLVNGKEIAADARGANPNPNAAKADLTVDLAGAAIAPGQVNKVEVVVWNAEGYLSSRGFSVEWKAPGDADAAAPELWAIVSGVSEYADPKLRLNFSSQDAETFAHALQLGGNRLFGEAHVHIDLLSSSGKPGELPPTKGNLQRAFVAAQKANPGDVFVVYLAGHGVALSDLYAYPTAEARTLDLSDPAVRLQTAVTSDELVEWIKKIPAQHQVMILDTCAAGAAAAKLVEKRDVPGDQIRALDQLKDRTGFYVLMGSAADAVSYEASRYGQGLLTYALLQGMKGAALKNDVDVDVSKLFQFAVDDVPGLAHDIGGVQRPQIIAPTGGASFDLGQLQPEDQKQIQLAAEKPIFLRPQLVNAEGPDDLDLAAAVRRELRNETYVSARGSQAVPDAIFVDEDEMPGAIRIGGTYVLEDKKITATIWLSRDKAKTHLVVEGSADDIPSLATKMTAAILDAGKRL